MLGYEIVGKVCRTAGSSLYRVTLTNGSPALAKLLDWPDVRPAHITLLRHEYDILRSFSVPGLIKPFAFSDESGAPAMLLEHFDGDSLDSVLRRHQFDVRTCLEVVRQLAVVLDRVHAANLTYNGITPANVMINAPSGRICVADASLVMRNDSTDAAALRHVLNIDLAYNAPELTGHLDLAADPRLDLYALGVLCYRMLTGILPFEPDDTLGWIRFPSSHRPRRPDSLVEIPPAVSEIALRLLEKSPDDRYQTARGLLFDIEKCSATFESMGTIPRFALGTHDVSDRFHLSRELYGREIELLTLLDAFDVVANRNQPWLVLLAGPPGIGKSSLVQQFSTSIAGRGAGHSVAGAFDEHTQDIPYATLTTALGGLIERLSRSAEPSALYRERIMRAVDVNGQLIVDLIPQLESIIGVQPAVPKLPLLESQNRFRLTFRRFVGAFALPGHPLIIFLDDLQWADAGSIALIEDLIAYADVGGVMIVGAYRDGDRDQAVLGVEALRRNLRPVMIELRPLGEDSLRQLVVDSFHCEPSKAQPIVELLVNKADGNPFFVRRILYALHDAGQIAFDVAQGRWSWNAQQIADADLAHDVIELMAQQIRRFEPDLQAILNFAACIGNEFDVETLAAADPAAPPNVADRLLPAVRAGLLVEAPPASESRPTATYRWYHEGVRRAAHSLRPAEERAETHLRIGRLLLSTAPPEHLPARIFEIAAQLNLGSARINDRAERYRLAELNLIAGRRARTSAAYRSASNYFTAGMSLLDDEGWDMWHDLAFALHLERAECQALADDREIPDLLAAAHMHARTRLERASVYRQEIQYHSAHGRLTQATAVGLACLSLFGVDLPARPSPVDIEYWQTEVWRALGTRSIEAIADLPLMTDPELLVVAEVAVSLGSPVAQDGNLALYWCLSSYLTALSLRSGNCGASTWGYQSFGRQISSLLDRNEDGYRFGLAARSLVERHDFGPYQTLTYQGLGSAFVRRIPLRAAHRYLEAAVRASMRTGDLHRVALTHWLLVLNHFERGEHLAAVDADIDRYDGGLGSREFVSKVFFIDAREQFVLLAVLIRNLQGRTKAFGSFTVDDFDQTAYEARAARTPLSLNFREYWLYRMQALFLCGDYAGSLAAGGAIRDVLDITPGALSNHEFYTALSRAGVYDQSSTATQAQLIEAITARVQRLRTWSASCPENFQCKYLLVDAELSRVSGHISQAEHLYDAAAESARANGFVQHEAVAYETAANFYRARGLGDTAAQYLGKARACYARWGAFGKVRQIDATGNAWTSPPPGSSGFGAQ